MIILTLIGVEISEIPYLIDCKPRLILCFFPTFRAAYIFSLSCRKVLIHSAFPWLRFVNQTLRILFSLA